MTMTKPRKPNRFEMTFLMMWHGVLTGGVLLTYVSGDDVYFLHQFAGYVVCVAILVRLLAATLAPAGSPLALTLPKLFSAHQVGRSPILAWMAVALITVTALAALSGLLAESIGFDDLHEGLAEGFLPLFIFAHMAIVLWRTLGRKLSNLTAEDLDQAAARAQAFAVNTARQAGETIERVKPYLHNNR